MHCCWEAKKKRLLLNPISVGPFLSNIGFFFGGGGDQPSPHIISGYNAQIMLYFTCWQILLAKALKCPQNIYRKSHKSFL